MKGADKSNDIVVKRPQPWNVLGRLDTIETSINEIIASQKSSQKMTAVMFVVTQVPVWLMLLKK